jgi:hypothetical protein
MEHDTEHEYVPKLFVTLTDKHGRQHENHIRDVERFFIRLSRVTGTHLKCTVGGGVVDSHTHAVVYTLNNEQQRFDERIGKFQKWKVWEYKTCNDLGFQTWDWERSGVDGWKTLDYIARVDHTYQDTFYLCPKKKSVCRKGKCPYQGIVLNSYNYNMHTNRSETA